MCLKNSCKLILRNLYCSNLLGLEITANTYSMKGSVVLKKKLWMVFCFTSLFIMLILGVINMKSEKVPPSAKAVYLDYLEAIKSDFVRASDEYCHFETPTIKKLVIQSNDYLKSYHIISWEKLGKKLWAVNVSIESTYTGTDTFFNFIGLIDGKWYVMLNPSQIPAFLLKDTDITPYLTTGENIVPYEAVIGLNE